ncbi:tetratricopeptide repeat protein [Chelativorans sp. Marseille-P2723]|uniref:tetratricopeptide repeat protein n=1 Tax=Chelativorans sp. Marseille-P2723 TaxID=2709133 RepID=UPI00156E8F21|nr:tetratricopeptide repeat protein [Chelativorans sp. Marseille-P2723]
MKLNLARGVVPRLLAVAGVAILAACSTANSNRTSTLAQISVGERMLGYGDYDKAYALLDRIAENNPRSSVAALGLGEAYFRQGVLLKASAHYRRAIELSARLPGKLGLARVELARNNPAGAEVLLNDILQREPGNIHALTALGVVRDLDGRHDLAQELYRTVLNRVPTHKEALNNLSLSLALAGEAKEAYPIVAELSRSNQNEAVIRQNLALIQYLAGDRGRSKRTALLDLAEGEAQANFIQVSKLVGRR